MLENRKIEAHRPYQGLQSEALASMSAFQITALLDNRNIKNLIQSGRVYALTSPNNWVDVTDWNANRISDWLDQGRTALIHQTYLERAVPPELRT